MVVIHWKRDNEAGGLVVGAAGDTPYSGARVLQPPQVVTDSPDALRRLRTTTTARTITLT